MEQKLLLLLLCVFLLIVAVQSYQGRKRMKARRIATIREHWGQVADREYSFEEYDRIQDYYVRLHPAHGIDEITWNDLDMDRLFCSLNHTYSSVGEEYLYSLLRNPAADFESLRKIHSMAEWFQKNPETAQKLQEIFMRMGRPRVSSVCNHLFSLTEAPVLNILPDVLADIGIVVSVIAAAFGYAPGIYFCIPLIIFNVVRYFSLKPVTENCYVGIAYLVSMTSYAGEISACKLPVLADINVSLTETAKTFRSCQRQAGHITLGGNMSGSFADILADYIRFIFHNDLIAYQSIIHTVKREEASLVRLYDQLGFLESTLAIASWRESLPYYTYPEYLKSSHAEFHAKDLFHPLITDPVSNSLDTKEDILLTGSNASGKSTFLKTAAVSLILSQSVATAPASSFTFVPGPVFSSMSLRDSLKEGESYYIAEIKAILRMLQPAGQTASYLFLDEVLRGTNTIERISAASQILLALSRTSSLVFAATHDLELTFLLENIYKNYHFSEDVTESDVSFSYLLKEGRANSRNAIRLLSLFGYDPSILEGASRMAQNFLDTGVWKLYNRETTACSKTV